MIVPKYSSNVKQRPLGGTKIIGGATADAFGAASAEVTAEVGKSLMNASNTILAGEQKRINQEIKAKNKAEREAEKAANKAEAEANKAARRQEQINYYDFMSGWDESQYNLRNKPQEVQDQEISQVVSEMSGSGYTSSSEDSQDVPTIDKWEAMRLANQRNIRESLKNSNLNDVQRAAAYHELSAKNNSDIENARAKAEAEQKKDLELKSTQHVTTATSDFFAVRNLSQNTVDASFDLMQNAIEQKVTSDGFTKGTDEFSERMKHYNTSAISSACSELLAEGNPERAYNLLRRYGAFMDPKEIEDVKDLVETRLLVEDIKKKGLTENEALQIATPEQQDEVKKYFDSKALQDSEDKKEVESKMSEVIFNGGAIPRQITLNNGRTHTLTSKEWIEYNKQKVEMAAIPRTPESDKLWKELESRNDTEVAHNPLNEYEKKTLPRELQEEYNKRYKKASEEWESDSKEAMAFISDKKATTEFKNTLQSIPELERTEIVMNVIKELNDSNKPADYANVTHKLKEQLVKYSIDLLTPAKKEKIDYINEVNLIRKNNPKDEKIQMAQSVANEIGSENDVYFQANPYIEVVPDDDTRVDIKAGTKINHETGEMTMDEIQDARKRGKTVNMVETTDQRTAINKLLEQRINVESDAVWDSTNGVYRYKQNGEEWIAIPNETAEEGFELRKK